MDAAERIDLYIGTYTDPDASKGIYQASLNLETGEITQPMLLVETPSPSYLALHPNGKLLYSVDESSNGDVHAFRITPQGLEEIGSVSVGSKAPCHIAIDSRGQFAYVSTFEGGRLAAIQLNEDGSLGEILGQYQSQGSSADPEQQAQPHMHFCLPSESGEFVYACDLGTDEVLAFRMGEEGLQPLAFLEMPAGSGPRHFALQAGGKRLFIGCQLSASIAVAERNIQSGELSLNSKIDLELDGTPLSGKSLTGIKLHPHLPFLYAAVSLAGVLAVVAVGEEGQLTVIDMPALELDEPRDFAIDPTGRWLVAGGQTNHELRVFEIDQARGTLTSTGQRVAVNKPVCLVFGPKPDLPE
jgi:6-phosphogluconolactonase